MSSTSLEKSSTITKRLSPFSSPSFYPLESEQLAVCWFYLVPSTYTRRRFMRDMSFSFVFFSPSLFFFLFFKKKSKGRINWLVLFFYFVRSSALILIGICIDEYLSSQHVSSLSINNNNYELIKQLYVVHDSFIWDLKTWKFIGANFRKYFNFIY